MVSQIKYLPGLRVPFDPKIIVLGFCAILVFWAGIYAIQIFAEEPYLVARSFYVIFNALGTNIAQLFCYIYELIPGTHASLSTLSEVPHWATLCVSWLWCLVVFSIFGAAICRMTAIRISKDESMPFTKALKFAWNHRITLIGMPIFLIFLMLFFYAFNLGTGWICENIPGLGPLLLIPGFFLILLSTLFFLFTLLGLFFGFPLIPAIVSVDGSAGTEVIVSMFHYPFARPWLYILYQALLAISLVVILWLGDQFLTLAFQTSLLRTQEPIVSYHIDKRWETLKIAYSSHEQEMPTFYIQHEAFERQTQLYQELEDSEKSESVAHQPKYYTVGMMEIWAYIQGTPVECWTHDPQSNETILQEQPMNLDILWKWNKYWACIALIFGLIYTILQYAICGYALAYLYSASTTLFLILRQEIDATECKKIWDEESERKLAMRLRSQQLAPTPVQPEPPPIQAKSEPLMPTRPFAAVKSEPPAPMKVEPPTLAKIEPPTLGKIEPPMRVDIATKVEPLVAKIVQPTLAKVEPPAKTEQVTAAKSAPFTVKTVHIHAEPSSQGKAEPPAVKFEPVKPAAISTYQPTIVAEPSAKTPSIPEDAVESEQLLVKEKPVDEPAPSTTAIPERIQEPAKPSTIETLAMQASKPEAQAPTVSKPEAQAPKPEAQAPKPEAQAPEPEAQASIASKPEVQAPTVSKSEAQASEPAVQIPTVNIVLTSTQDARMQQETAIQPSAIQEMPAKKKDESQVLPLAEAGAETKKEGSGTMTIPLLKRAGKKTMTLEKTTTEKIKPRSIND